MSAIYLSSAYLAPIEYYCKLLAYDHVYIEQYDHYIKQTYRNRCVIAAPDGALALTVPVVKPDTPTPKCLMRDIRISDHGNWRHLHWNALVSAYNHTPFFEYYMDDFRPFYEQKYTFLIDFNEALCRLVCELMDISPKLSRTTAYKTTFTEGEEDWRDAIRPKQASAPKHPSAPEHTAPFIARPYYQVFQERLGFLPNLSIVDLLFNLGPESPLMLTER
ncbi:MAG: WbqC family protein [Prevotellaceae bacterium]|jgi:hypothetical protein|nr:WbqC family protein [Prevotellaceae bacterium]